MADATTTPVPEIYTRHPLSQDLIDPDAVKIVRRLRKHGFEAYLVGGCVRDLVLGIVPKDFDVATSATPREIRGTFRNCRVIGRRFRLCHIFFHEKIVEVATFRTEPLAHLEEDQPEAAERAARESAAPAPPRREERPREAPRLAPPPAPASVLPPPPPPLAPAPPPPLAPLPPPKEKEAVRVHYFTGPSIEDDSGFSAGLLDETPAPVPAPSPVPAPAPLAAPAPSPLPSDLAPWEADEEASLRERQAVSGRRARALEEAAEAAEAEESAAGEASDVFERAAEALPERGAPRGEGRGHERERERPAHDRDEGLERGERRRREPRPGEDAGPRGRRRARWERLLDEDPPQGYGTADEDARLRDFTINALFYDVEGDRIIDYVGGMRDLEARVVRIIGDAEKRVLEDPVRILRGVKQAARLSLRFDPPTWDAFCAHAGSLATCSPRRILEEVLKLLASGASAECFRVLARAQALEHVVPELVPALAEPDSPVYRYLEALDRVPKERLSPEVMVAALFYRPIMDTWVEAGLGRPGESGLAGGRGPRESEAEAVADDVLRAFSSRGSLSKKTRFDALRIILAQRLLRRPRGRRMRAAKLVSRDWFDAALRLLEICVEAEGADREVIESWVSRAEAVRMGLEEPAEAPHAGEAPRALPRREGRPSEPQPLGWRPLEGGPSEPHPLEERALDSRPAGPRSFGGRGGGDLGDDERRGGRRRRRRGGRGRRRGGVPGFERPFERAGAEGPALERGIDPAGPARGGAPGERGESGGDAELPSLSEPIDYDPLPEL
jgi:poly(A) polymerase